MPAKTKMRHSKIMRDWNLTLLWECIIVQICWRLGNLKKTHLGNPQRPSAAKVWSSAADVWSADVWMGGSNISTFKHRHYNYGNSYSNSYADVWTCRCLNMPMCTIIPIRSPIITSISLDCLQQINLPMTLFNSILCPI